MDDTRNGNYIRIYRKIMRWEWYTDGNTMRVFLHLLLNANWRDGKYRGYTIPRGSLAISRRKLAKELRLSEREVRTALEHLEATHELTHKTTHKFTVVTLVNYDNYQVFTNASDPLNDPQSDPQATHRATHKVTHKTTHKATSKESRSNPVFKGMERTSENKNDPLNDPQNDPQSDPQNDHYIKEYKEREERENIYSGKTERPFGLKNNVYLTADEFAELMRLYPDRYDQMIDDMSLYKSSTGKVYRNDFDTLVLWERNKKRDEVKPELDFLNIDKREWDLYQWSKAIEAGYATQEECKRLRKRVI